MWGSWSAYDSKGVGDKHRHESQQQNSLPVLAQLHAWLEKAQPQVRKCIGKTNQLRGQQLDQVGALHQRRFLAD